MADLFHSPRLTLIRAKHHVNDFNRIESEFVNSQPWTYGIDEETEPGLHRYRIKFTRDVPEELSCILFDITNNLRAVLDQCGYAAAIASKSQSLKAIKFPFGPDLDHWKNNLKGGCSDLPAAIRAIFEGYNSYKGGNNTLWAINEIANAKKHLALIPLNIGNARTAFFGHATDGTQTGFFFNPDPSGREVPGVGWNSEEREMVIAVVSPHVKLNISGHFSFQIAIDGIDVFRDRPAELVFNAMCDEVESVLMATEAECRRLGFELSV